MAVPKGNSFLTTIPVTISGAEVTAHQVVRPFTTRIEDETTVKVYYDGVLIPRDASPNSKYYYELVTVLDGSWPGLGPALPVIPDSSTATFTLKENVGYVGTGYGSTGGTASFATNIMTLVTEPTSGSLSIGQSVTVTGMTGGTTITGLLTGSLNVAGSTYSLSTTPGTLGTISITTGITTPSTNTLSTYDSFVISYYYVVYMV